jgi:hypothetical protein
MQTSPKQWMQLRNTQVAGAGCLSDQRVAQRPALVVPVEQKCPGELE